MARSLLFAPASRPDVMAKALAGAADAVVLDLEDAVAAGQKANARRHVLDALAACPAKPVLVRINAPSTDDFPADMAALRGLGGIGGIRGLLVPKAETAADVARVAEATDIGLLPLIESCLGLRNAYEICTAAASVIGIGLASAEEGDLIADMGARWSPGCGALAYARAKTVVDARAAGLDWLVDGAFMNLADDAALRQESRLARDAGFVAKIAIHPRQIDALNEVYTPSAEAVEDARGLLAALADADARGLGAVTYRGRMVDAANARLARRTLALAGAALGTIP